LTEYLIHNLNKISLESYLRLFLKKEKKYILLNKKIFINDKVKTAKVIYVSQYVTSFDKQRFWMWKKLKTSLTILKFGGCKTLNTFCEEKKFKIELCICYSYQVL